MCLKRSNYWDIVSSYFSLSDLAFDRMEKSLSLSFILSFTVFQLFKLDIEVIIRLEIKYLIVSVAKNILRFIRQAKRLQTNAYATQLSQIDEWLLLSVSQMNLVSNFCIGRTPVRSLNSIRLVFHNLIEWIRVRLAYWLLRTALVSVRLGIK